jgi:hypothetical protein
MGQGALATVAFMASSATTNLELAEGKNADTVRIPLSAITLHL